MSMTRKRFPLTLSGIVKILLFSLPFLVYLAAYGGGGYELLGLDDRLYYLGNPALHEGRAAGLLDLWRTTFLSDYAPVAQLTLWIDLALFGTEQWWGAHLHSLAWFGLGVLAVHQLTLLLTQRPALSFSVALLYALHPICTASILWLAQRKNLVALALCLWSLSLYVASDRKATNKEAWRSRLGALALGALALLAKPSAVALPVMLLAYELFLGVKPARQRVLSWLPFCAMAAIHVAANLMWVREDLDRTLLGGSRAAAFVSDGPVLLRYLEHTVWPRSLSFYYYVEELGVWSLWGWGVWALVLALVGAVMALGRTRRMLAFGWFLAVASMAPALNLIPQLAPMTDHYLHWALPGLLLTACVFVSDQLGRLKRPQGPSMPCLLTLGAALFLTWCTSARIPVYANGLALFQNAVRNEPESALNRAQLTRAFSERGEQERAGDSARATLACRDAHRLLAQDRALVIRLAALRQSRAGDVDGAWAMTLEACKAFRADETRFQEATLAEVAVGLGKHALAIQMLEPGFTRAHRDAAQKLRGACRTGERLPHQMAPLLCLQGTGQDAYARQWGYRQGLQSQHLLAVAYLQAGQTEAAFDVAAVAVNTAPEVESGRVILAGVYRRLGLPDAADRVVNKEIGK